MSRSDAERVADILEAAQQIGEVVRRGRQAWNTGRIAQLTVERLLEIIGESAQAMSAQARTAYPEVPWRDVIGLRTSYSPTTTTGSIPHRSGRSHPPKSLASPSSRNDCHQTRSCSATAQQLRGVALATAGDLHHGEPLRVTVRCRGVTA